MARRPAPLLISVIALGVAAGLSFFPYGAYLLFIPLLAAIVILRPQIRIRPIDLLWGLAVGLLARGVAALIDMGIYGASAPPLGYVGPALVVVLIAPLIEELFFRGALLNALSRWGRVVSVVLSAAAFAGMHAVGGGSLATVLGTLVFGLAAGTIVVATKRVGGAIIAHVIFNGSVVLAGLFLGSSGPVGIN